MGNRELVRKTWLPRAPESLFSFFSDAWNLELITPPWLHFEILTHPPLEMRQGTEIDYRLRLRGVKFHWKTLISAWDPPRRFVDEQRRGPYRFWRHEHSFEESDSGTLMTDRIAYRAPGGRWVDQWLVRPELDRIFNFRAHRLSRLFGDGTAADSGKAAPDGPREGGERRGPL